MSEKQELRIRLAGANAKICELRQAKEKAEAEVAVLRWYWTDLVNKILSEHDKDGYCRLVVSRESAQRMLDVLKEKDGGTNEQSTQGEAK
jgi:hypothetical protein